MWANIGLEKKDGCDKTGGFVDVVELRRYESAAIVRISVYELCVRFTILCNFDRIRTFRSAYSSSSLLNFSVLKYM